MRSAAETDRSPNYFIVCGIHSRIRAVDAIVKFIYDNWKTLFDGILTVILAGFSGFLLKKLWTRLFHKKESTLAPQTLVQTSGPLAPTASAIDGGTVHQTVNYSSPTATPPSAERSVQRGESEPKPPSANIQFHTTRVAKIAPDNLDDPRVVHEAVSGMVANAFAILLNITNDALKRLNKCSERSSNSQSDPDIFQC